LKFLDRVQPLALLVMRATLGAIMIAHGSQKVFGGMPQVVGMMGKIGVPGWMAYVVAAAEFGGGILVVLGLLTRIGALAIAIDMTVAILKVHLKNGLRGPGGFEYPLAVFTLAFALIFFGAGPISLDWVFGGRSGTNR
jgi:putative oxidoreductase